MTTIYLETQHLPLSPCVATIGFFDGVHLGHRHLIGQLLRVAHSLGLASTVVTFESHPRQVLDPHWRPELLSTLSEKEQLLSATGIDRLVVLTFNAQLASLSARDFMYDILYSRLGVRTLLMGYDNHFGHRTADSTEGFADYVDYGAAMGMDVVLGSPFTSADGVRVSSSKVRRMLADGAVEQAARALGRCYSVSGLVVSGQHIGTLLGYPTANIRLDDACKLTPAPGVYAITVVIDGLPTIYQGMMNIGCRPTFDGTSQTLEAHIFHFHGDLYGRRLTISFVGRLRSEMRFESAAALAAQLAVDARNAQQLTIQASHNND